METIKYAYDEIESLVWILHQDDIISSSAAHLIFKQCPIIDCTNLPLLPLCIHVNGAVGKLSYFINFALEHGGMLDAAMHSMQSLFLVISKVKSKKTPALLSCVDKSDDSALSFIDFDAQARKNQTQQSKIAKSVQAYIDNHYAEPLTLSFVANELFISNSYLSKVFKREIGCNFSEYLNQRRITAAKIFLTETDNLIDSVAEAVGYNSSAYFIALFKQTFGTSPLNYRKEHRIII